MTAITAKIRPKSGQHHAIPRNYAIARGLLALYPHFFTLLPPSRPDRADGLDRQADRVRGPRPGAGVGHARPHIGGLPVCVGYSLNAIGQGSAACGASPAPTGCAAGSHEERK